MKGTHWYTETPKPHPSVFLPCLHQCWNFDQGRLGLLSFSRPVVFVFIQETSTGWNVFSRVFSHRLRLHVCLKVLSAYMSACMHLCIEVCVCDCVILQQENLGLTASINISIKAELSRRVEHLSSCEFNPSSSLPFVFLDIFPHPLCFLTVLRLAFSRFHSLSFPFHFIFVPLALR